jgi:SPP1 gp7 family putative phage head morphogenesis protein
MPTVNEEWFDRQIDHQVNLQHFANGLIRKLRSLLNRADAKLHAELQGKLQTLDRESFTVRRLDNALDSARALTRQTYADWRTMVQTDLGDLAAHEVEFQYRTVLEILPTKVIADVGITRVTAQSAIAAIQAEPFRGRLLSEWSESLSDAKMQRVSDTLRIGYVSGDTIQQMTRQVKEITGLDTRNAEAVARTATSHTAGYSRDQFIKKNADLYSEERWVSTLDTRTTEHCMLRDGKLYDVETHKPIGHKLPWGAGPGRFHWNCRSTSVPVIKGWKALGIDLPAVERASMDGQAPGDTTYTSWIKRQSAARQDEILGPMRGKLMRQGKLTLDKFATEQGRWLTLDELRKRENAAFKRAGI